MTKDATSQVSERSTRDGLETGHLPDAVPSKQLMARLQGAIDERSALVAVIGLGYVGLPLVELFAGVGFRVLGFDIDPAKIDALRAGQSYIGHITSNRVAALRDQGRFEATSDFARWPRPMPF